MERSRVECRVTRRESQCWVRCEQGMVSPADWAQCVKDRSDLKFDSLHHLRCPGLAGRGDGQDYFSPASRNVTKLYQISNMELLTVR